MSTLVKDYTGKVFGKLTVINKTGTMNKDQSTDWLCDCSCGAQPIISSCQLQRGVKSCGCTRRKYKDLTQMKFGKLTALSKTDKRSLTGAVVWACQCECGTNMEVSSNALLLRRHGIKSCGCAGRKYPREQSTLRYYHSLHSCNQNIRGFGALSYENWCKFVGKPCYYCGDPAIEKTCKSGDPIFTHGIDRRDNSIGYEVDNCVSCCSTDNFAKRIQTEEEYRNQCIKVTANTFGISVERLQELLS
jgi:hypothetical protein